MDKSFNDHLQTLHNLFEKGFSDAYRDANVRKRRKLMPYVPSLHRRWYYSVLIENTHFTPANIVDSMLAYYGGEAGLFVQPVLRSTAKYSGFDFKLVGYGGVHPVIADMRALLEYCAPHVDIQEGDYFFDGQMLELAVALSIADPSYVSFLLDVAFRLKWVAKVPSLHVNRVEPVKDWESRLMAAAAEVFDEIVNAAVQVCAHNLRELVALPVNLFTDNFVRAMLTEPMETDALFERVYDVLGYTLEDLVELSMDADEVDIDSEDGAFLAGTFMMGLVLDQHFYTPFGYFLKLIKPHYVLPFDFGGEVDEFLATPMSVTADEVFIAFFAPCSSYTLTELGLKTLNVKRTDKNFFDVWKYIPFETLRDSIFADPEMTEILIKMAKILPPISIGAAPPRGLYTFRVRMKDDPTMWMHLHMPANATLNEFYDEIIFYFPLRENGDFSFFHDAAENRFAEYPSAKRAKPHTKKTADTRLDALDFDRQNKMLMTAYNQALPFAGTPPVLRVELEMLGFREAEPMREYPFAARISKAMREFLEEEREI